MTEGHLELATQFFFTREPFMTTAWYAKNISAPRGFVRQDNDKYPNRTIRLTIRFCGSSSTTNIDLPSTMPNRADTFPRLYAQLNGYNLYTNNLHACLTARRPKAFPPIRIPAVTDFCNVSFILENQEV
jgi:hypothetical protein